MSETTRQLFAVPIHLAADIPVGTDGTLWSHAVNMGDYVYNGVSFTIDAGMVESFVRNFAADRKVPVDYDHGTTNGIADGSRAVPKAGDVVEMRAVLSDADITPEIQTAIDKSLAERKALGLSTDVDPRGLWVRWRPTPRAQSMIKDREYTEMSVAFLEDAPDKHGNYVGARLMAVALTNKPFVDTMVSIAASQRHGGNAAEPRTEPNKMSKWHALVAAFTGKPVVTDDEAERELSAKLETVRTAETHTAELRNFRDVVAAEFSAPNMTAGDAVAKIRELTAKVRELSTASATATADARKTVVDGILTKHEKKLTAPAKEYFGKQLSAELANGVKAGETETEKTLEALAPIPELAGDKGQQSASAGDSAGITPDAVFVAELNKAQELPEVKALSAKGDVNGAMLLAVSRARAALEKSAS